MLVHKEVYTELYFKLAEHFVRFDLSEDEGRTKYGKRFKLKSENIWKDKRIISENGKRTIVFVISKIIGGEKVDYRIFYRLLYAYDDKSGTNKNVKGAYQIIPGSVIACMVKHLVFSLPQKVKRYLEFLDAEKYKLLISEIEGEALLRSFVTQRCPHNVSLLIESYFNGGDSSTTSNIRHFNPTLEFNTAAPYSKTAHLIQCQTDHSTIDETIHTYFQHISNSQFIDCLNYWEICAQDELWKQSSLNLFKEYTATLQVKNLHIFGHMLALSQDGDVTCSCKTYYEEVTFVPDASNDFSVARQLLSVADSISDNSNFCIQQVMKSKERSVRSINAFYLLREDMKSRVSAHQVKYVNRLKEITMIFQKDTWKIKSIISINIQQNTN